MQGQSWMLNLGGNFDGAVYLRGFKLASHGLLIAKRKYYTVETRQHLD